MKTPATLSLASALPFVLAAAPFAFCAAAPPRSAGHEHPVKFAERHTSATVSRGSLRRDVAGILGEPQSKLTPDVWVYHQFGLPLGFGGCRDCDRLVVTFSGDAVTDLQLINATAEKIRAARLRATSEQARVAAK